MRTVSKNAGSPLFKTCRFFARRAAAWQASAVLACLLSMLSAANAADESSETPKPADVKPILPDGEDQLLKLLEPESMVWLDPERKRLVMAGKIALREGQLEMFACLSGTKEHESVVAIDTKAYVVHAGLLACGAEVGSPVQFDPAFKPATGTEIEVTVYWRDKSGELKEVRAQELIRDVKTGKAMAHNWVFAGSGFLTDEQTGKRFYLAEDGDLICVSNFSSALLDLPVESSQSAGSLLFEAFTDHIPPQGTPVTVVLTPKLDAAKEKRLPERRKPAAPRQ